VIHEWQVKLIKKEDRDNDYNHAMSGYEERASGQGNSFC
jgi:hypothetical protein